MASSRRPAAEIAFASDLDGKGTDTNYDVFVVPTAGGPARNLTALRVLIAGVAGLTLARALRQRGITAESVEWVSDWQPSAAPFVASARWSAWMCTAV